MVVEARYTPGPGVLIGAGAHWVLVTDPDDEDVLGEIWDVLTSPHPFGPPILDQVLAVVESAFDGAPPALAMADLTAGSSTTVSRGSGQVRLDGSARVLSLTDQHDPSAAPARRLVRGMASASRVEVFPARTSDEPPSYSGGLIDGIPAAILAATGPEGPPPPRPRRRNPQWVAAQDTGSSVDTTEPDPDFIERIEQGGHTTIRAPHPPPDAASPDDGTLDDHDGSTVHRPAHLAQAATTTVLAVSCPLGHLTPPTSPACRVCHQRLAPQEPRRVPRPTLGGLRLPTGEVVPLDRGVVLGRKPAPLDGSHDWPHLVHLPPDHSFVSRMHLQIELDGWNVLARDLDSRGGTTLAQPGQEPRRMTPGDAYVLEPGASLDLAEVYAVRYETGPVAAR